MLELKRVGVLCREAKGDRLIESLQRIFARASLECDLLTDDDTPSDAPEPDLVITLGGDGTVLHALERFPHVPILPINFGHVGFLTAGNENDAEKMIFRLLANDYFIEERLLLTSEFKGKKRHVVNEISVKGATKMISVDLTVDGRLIHTIRGDGAIVGTPTGSTSYLLSTGSSIVAPKVQCIIVNGINEHRFASRSLVLPPTTEIRLRINQATRESDIFVSHDGKDKLPISIGEEVIITKAGNPARLIFFDSHAFFDNLKSRLDW